MHTPKLFGISIFLRRTAMLDVRFSHRT